MTAISHVILHLFFSDPADSDVSGGYRDEHLESDVSVDKAYTDAHMEHLQKCLFLFLSNGG